MAAALETLYVEIQARLGTLETQLTRAQTSGANSANRIQGSFDQAFGNIGNLANKLGGIFAAGAIASGLQNLAAGALAFAKQASEADTAAAIFDKTILRFGQNAGAADALVAKLADQFGVLPTQVEAAATTILRAGGSLEDVEKSLTAAGASTLAAGGDVTRAFDNVSTAVATGRSELLESSGIVTNASDAFESYAKSVGVSAKSLTQQQKVQALSTAIFKESKYEIADLDQLTGGLSGALNKQTKAQTELGNTVGRIVTPAVIGVTNGITKLLQAGNDWILNSKQLYAGVQATGRGFEGLTNIVIGGARAIVAGWGLVPAVFGASFASINNALGEIGAGFQAFFSKVSDGFAKLAKGDFTGAINDVRAAYDASLAGVGRAFDALKGKPGEVAAATATASAASASALGQISKGFDQILSAGDVFKTTVASGKTYAIVFADAAAKTQAAAAASVGAKTANDDLAASTDTVTEKVKVSGIALIDYKEKLDKMSLAQLQSAKATARSTNDDQKYALVHEEINKRLETQRQRLEAAKKGREELAKFEKDQAQALANMRTETGFARDLAIANEQQVRAIIAKQEAFALAATNTDQLTNATKKLQAAEERLGQIQDENAKAIETRIAKQNAALKSVRDNVGTLTDAELDYQIVTAGNFDSKRIIFLEEFAKRQREATKATEEAAQAADELEQAQFRIANSGINAPDTTAIWRAAFLKDQAEKTKTLTDETERLAQAQRDNAAAIAEIQPFPTEYIDATRDSLQKLININPMDAEAVGAGLLELQRIVGTGVPKGFEELFSVAQTTLNGAAERFKDLTIVSDEYGRSLEDLIDFQRQLADAGSAPAAGADRSVELDPLDINKVFEGLKPQTGDTFNALADKLQLVRDVLGSGALSAEMESLFKILEKFLIRVSKPPEGGSGFIQLLDEFGGVLESGVDGTKYIQTIDEFGNVVEQTTAQILATLKANAEYQASLSDIGGKVQTEADTARDFVAELNKTVESLKLTDATLSTLSDQYKDNITALETLRDAEEYGSDAWLIYARALDAARTELEKIVPVGKDTTSQFQKETDVIREGADEWARHTKFLNKDTEAALAAQAAQAALASSIGQVSGAVAKGFDALKGEGGLGGLIDAAAGIAGLFGPEGQVIGAIISGVGKAAIAYSEFLESIDPMAQRVKAFKELEKQTKDLAKGFDFIDEKSTAMFTSIESKSRGWLADFFIGPELSIKIDEFGVKIAKTLEGGVANGLRSGLKASTFEEGLGIFRQTLGESVIDGLIDGFMKSEAIKGVIGPAVAKLAKALADDDPTNDAGALAEFDAATTKLEPAFKQFYEGLGKVRKQFGVGDKALASGSLAAYEAQLAELDKKFKATGSSSERGSLKREMNRIQAQIDAINNGGFSVTPDVPVPSVTTVQLPNISAQILAAPEWLETFSNGIGEFRLGIQDFGAFARALMEMAGNADGNFARDLRFARGL